MKIKLNIDRVLQSSFELKALNLLFVFQVNCPGCFLYGFPLVNKLHEKYDKDELNVLGISTAFEDFDLNNTANTKLLLTEKKTVGATRHTIGEYYSQAIDFPIAVDRLTTGAALATPENIEFLCETISGGLIHEDRLSVVDRDVLRQRANAYLQRHSQTSATFTLNNLSGTPTFLLVNRNLQLLEQWFGHVPEANITKLIENHVHTLDNVQ